MKQLKDLLAQKTVKDLYVLSPDQKIEEAVDLMFKYNIHHILIIDKEAEKEVAAENGLISYGYLRGIVSDRDVRVALNAPVLFMDKKDTLDDVIKTIMNRNVEGIMSSPVIKKYDNTPIKEALMLMMAEGINALPVVRSGTNKLIGVITKSDMMRLLLRYLDEDDADEKTRRCDPRDA